ncbi:helix-turn-helix domain-containing protein [Arthrobacter sp. MI7-26]|uniref:helix-turn-helix domain-containing protein n=1 Tax=Arthrobacter sp. MI7-26 TaxID=2993653 RepID=UPI0022498268|nr:helix-turn-helix transcriptional regulator [Arthrobacter sp. MI7-26]MCX2750040.1 helix-turn-helix domain-containing protein [Arthrobacter sp. MI7-26]
MLGTQTEQRWNGRVGASFYNGSEGGVARELGEGIRAQRERMGLSLRAVASTVGISASMLSQVETGKLHPSVATLYQIASHLGISVDLLMGVDGSAARLEPDQNTARVAVMRAAEGPTIERASGVTWQPLAGQPAWSVQTTLVTYAARGASTVDKKMTRHNGIESGYLLAGELTLLLGFERTLLRPGDSFCFDATEPHLFVNESATDAKGIWFVTGGEDSAGNASQGPSFGSLLPDADPMRVLRNGI